MKKAFILFICCILLTLFSVTAQKIYTLPESYNPVWTTQSKNASESMPCGGGSIGLNVWVENNDLLIYISKSDAFEENNTLNKLGRLRISISPNPFENAGFRQELKLNDGYISINSV